MDNKYHDPRWQKFRLERLQMSDWKCDGCGDSESKLNIHHSFYVANRMPWDYIPHSTIVLCDQCHQHEHEFTGDGRPESLKWAEWEVGAACVIGSAVERCRKRNKMLEGHIAYVR
jgi:hypothetical protein